MISLLYGVMALLAFWWLSRLYSRTNPAILAKVIKRFGGFALLGLGAFMLMRGRIDMAVMIGGAGAWLLGWSIGLPRLGGGSATPSTGKTSRVRSAMIEMELDHDTGDMRGTILGGRFEGRPLQALSEQELQALYVECAASDPEGVRLLEAYFDRRFPGWRKDAHGDADSGASAQAQSGAMTEEEAYQILGLEPGSDVEAIKRAHRALMMKLHPDQGGSTYLASRVNEAKDILLSRHR
jgi:hypothetical protein